MGLSAKRNDGKQHDYTKDKASAYLTFRRKNDTLTIGTRQNPNTHAEVLDEITRSVRGKAG